MESGQRQRRNAVLVTSLPGAADRTELERQAGAGERHRKDYVEVAGLLDADIIDSDFVFRHGSWLARLLARRVGLPVGQVWEAFRRRRGYDHVLAWADRLGLPLALLHKLTRSDCDLVLLSVDLAAPKKARFIRRFRVHTHIRAILTPSSRQMAIAQELGVPNSKLVLDPHGVDTRFWHPQETAVEDMICVVGWEARDYATLVKAVRGLQVDVRAAVGSMVFSSGEVEGDRLDAEGRRRLPDLAPLKGTQGYQSYERWAAELGGSLPANVIWYQQLSARELRVLYAKARFVVIPLHDVEFDAGATAILEAMAMGKAVVLSRAAGQIDLVRDGMDGVYVPPADASALRATLEHLLSHPEEAERMGRSARARVEARFELDDYAARVASVVAGR